MSKISFLDAFPPNWLQKYNKKMIYLKIFYMKLLQNMII